MLAGHFYRDRAKNDPAGVIGLEESHHLATGRAGTVRCVLDGHIFRDEGLALALSTEAESDAGLVALAYARHGAGLLDHLRGSFAFLIWDEESGRGLVAQGQIGTRAIYLAQVGEALLFASELVDLLRLLPRRPAPDQHSVAHFLFGGAQLPGRSLYEGVRPLRGAHCIELGPDGWDIRRYWAPTFRGTSDLPRTELGELLREKVERAVRRRIAGRRPGILLSGGLDSSVVTAVAAPVAERDEPLQTYSCVFPGRPDYDESARIESTIAGLPVIGHRFHLESQGAFALSLGHLARWGFPVLGPGSLVEAAPLEYAAADGVEVVLDGQGGDEVFGASPFLIADRLARGRIVSAVALARRFPGLDRRASWKEAAILLRQYGLKGAVPHSIGDRVRRRHDPKQAAPDVLNTRAKGLFAESDDPWAWKLGGDGPRWWRYMKHSLVDQPHYEGRHENWRQQRANYGVEARSPLYDIELIEYALTIPPALAFDPELTRPLIREAMRGRMPEDVRTHRKKANFSAFAEGVVFGRDFPAIERMLTAPDAEILAYVDPAGLRRWLDWRPETAGAQGLRSVTIWSLARAESWLRTQADPEFPRQLLASGAVPAPVCKPVPAAVAA